MSCRPESAGAGSMPQEINLVETDTDVEERRRQCLEELSVTSRTVPEDAAAIKQLGSEAEQKVETVKECEMILGKADAFMLTCKGQEQLDAFNRADQDW